MIKDILDNYYSLEENNDGSIDRDIGLFSLTGLMSEKSVRLATLYFSVFGTEYSVFGAGKNLSCICVIGAILLIYRFLTVEQFNALLPQYGKYRLSNFCNWCIQKDKPLIATADLDKKQVYYYLTETGYNYFRSFFPKEFLSAARIPVKSGKLPSRTLHDIPLRDVPYGCLSLNDFTVFDWFTSIKLLEGKTPAESVYSSMNSDRHYKTQQTEQSKIIADGIMLWRYSNKGAIIIEQDKGTENESVIEGKLFDYGNYLTSINDSDSIYLVFNVYLSRNTHSKNVKSTLISTFDNISLLMAHDNITDLDTFYSTICNNGHSNHNKQNAFTFMRRLLENFMEDGHSLNEGIESLKNYVKQIKEAQSRVYKDTSPQSKAHYTKLKKLAAEIINQLPRTLKKNRKNHDTNDYSNLITAVNNGSSILFTDNLLSHAYYLFPYESGFLSRIVENIENSYGERNICTKYHLFRTQEGIVLRNCIMVNSQQESQTGYYFVQEISCDITSYYRLSKFFKAYTGNGAELHFLILVSSPKDALRFVQETNCLDKFCSKENILDPNQYNLTVRFLDYGPYNGPVSSPELFLPHNSDIIKTKSI